MRTRAADTPGTMAAVEELPRLLGALCGVPPGHLPRLVPIPAPPVTHVQRDMIGHQVLLYQIEHRVVHHLAQHHEGVVEVVAAGQDLPFIVEELSGS